MFGKGKKLKKVPADVDPKLAELVHVMPERFYVAPKKKNTGLWLVIIFGVVLISGLAGAAYFVNQGLWAPQNTNGVENVNSPLPVRNNNQNVNEPEPVNANSNVNLNVNEATSTSTPITTPTSTPEDINANMNENVNTNTNTNPPQVLPTAPDIDGDGLSALEESLYGTSPINLDTDTDGYSDGSELLSGYDPTQSGKKLVDSQIFSSYNHGSYTISYPSSWSVKELSGGQTDVIFQSAGGEFIEVIIVSNQQRLSISDWYNQQFSDAPASMLTSVKVNNTQGLLSRDQLTYYLTNPNDLSQIYLITYNTGNAVQKNFMMTFNVMVKTFVLK